MLWPLYSHRTQAILSFRVRNSTTTCIFKPKSVINIALEECSIFLCLLTDLWLVNPWHFQTKVVNSVPHILYSQTVNHRVAVEVQRETGTQRWVIFCLKFENDSTKEAQAKSLGSGWLPDLCVDDWKLWLLGWVPRRPPPLYSRFDDPWTGNTEQKKQTMYTSPRPFLLRSQTTPCEIRNASVLINLENIRLASLTPRQPASFETVLIGTRGWKWVKMPRQKFKLRF